MKRITNRDINEFEKIAVQSEAIRSALDALGIMGIAGTGVAAASSLYTTLKDKIKSHNAYKQMFDEFPELQEAPRTQVDKYWNVLNDFAPKLTTNPLVAGQFVSNMMQYGMRGIDHNTVGQLTTITKDIDQIQNPRMFQDFASRASLEALQSGDSPFMGM